MLTLDERNGDGGQGQRRTCAPTCRASPRATRVDQAAQALDALGIADYMIEAGGEVRTRGRNADGRPWQIAIERPDAMPQRAHRIVPLSGLAMATSGDYRIYFEPDGGRYCHEIDPATGRRSGTDSRR